MKEDLCLKKHPLQSGMNPPEIVLRLGFRPVTSGDEC